MKETGPQILVVDSEPAVRRFLHTLLPSRGYLVSEAGSGQEALAAVRRNQPDVILLDLGLPDIDGIEATRLLRAWTGAPIILLSVRNGEEEQVAALEAGADDYLTKPFRAQELLIRLNVALRHSAQLDPESSLSSSGLVLNLTQRLVTVGRVQVRLAPTECAVLKLLMAKAGQVLTHHQILRQVWGPGHEQELQLLRVTIGSLRRKIEPDPIRPWFILTVPGVGYRLAGSLEHTPKPASAQSRSDERNLGA